MILGDAEGICRSEVIYIRTAVVELVLGAIEGGIEKALVAKAGLAAMLGQLLFMQRKDDSLEQPSRLFHLFRKLPKEVSTLTHDRAGDIHLFFEFGIIRGKTYPADGFGKM